MREQSKYARVSPSRKLKGNSVLNDMLGKNAEGMASTRSVKKAYKAGTVGEKMKDGDSSSQGSMQWCLELQNAWR